MSFFYFCLSQKSRICYTIIQSVKVYRLVKAMSEDNNPNSAVRRKHVQRLKKIIILFLLVLIVIPIICCIVLFVQVYNLNRRLDSLESQLGTLSLQNAEQQEQTQDGLSENRTMERGETVKGQATAEATDVNSLTEENRGEEPADAALEEPSHKVYLTFDDGPSKSTGEILDILSRYDVKATFFVVGKEDSDSREAIDRIVEEGHSVGLHSYSHEYSDIYSSVEAFAEDYMQLQDYVYQVTGQKSRLYRFPGGSSNTVSDIDMQEFADYLHEQGVEFYDWNVSSGDGGSMQLDVDSLVENCTKGITDRGTSIILLHDSADKKTTVEALPIIIENILAMDDTVILPITEETKPVQHIETEDDK